MHALWVAICFRAYALPPTPCETATAKPLKEIPPLATESDTYRLLRPFVILATVTLAVVILYCAKIVFVPLALATLFTFILSPPVIWLRRHGVPRWPAALFVTGLACVLVVAACWAVTLQLRDLFK